MLYRNFCTLTLTRPVQGQAQPRALRALPRHGGRNDHSQGRRLGALELRVLAREADVRELAAAGERGWLRQDRRRAAQAGVLPLRQPGRRACAVLVWLLPQSI